MKNPKSSDEIEITDTSLMVAAADPDDQIMSFWIGFERRILQMQSNDAGRRMAWASFSEKEEAKHPNYKNLRYVVALI